MALAVVGFTLEYVWVGLTLALWPRLPIYALWASPCFTLIGGGAGTFGVAAITLLTDVVPESKR